MEPNLEGDSLVVHAIDLVIADLQRREHPECDEQILQLQRMRLHFTAPANGTKS